MPRGGDRRPIQRPEGRELEYAALLMHAMCADESEAGVRFNQERHVLFQGWGRLTSFLNSYQLPGWGEPPSSLENFPKYFNLLVHPHSVEYPKPRPLSPAELEQYNYRDCARDEALRDLDQELRPYEEGTPQENNLLWEESNKKWNHWVKEIYYLANPNIRRRRSSRSTVRQYLTEVEDFCLKWNLNARWASSAIHQSHFLSANKYAEEQLIEPLSIYVIGTWSIETYPLVMALPGVDSIEFERDFSKFRHMMLETTIDAPPGNIKIRRHPTRLEMASLEHKHQATSVVVDWNGRSHYPSRYGSKKQLTVTEHVLEECEDSVIQF